MSFDSDEESIDPVEDEHHVIFDCPSYTYARQLFPDIFGSNIVTVSQFLNQPDCNRVARFLTWVKTYAYGRGLGRKEGDSTHARNHRG